MPEFHFSTPSISSGTRCPAARRAVRASPKKETGTENQGTRHRNQVEPESDEGGSRSPIPHPSSLIIHHSSSINPKSKIPLRSYNPLQPLAGSYNIAKGTPIRAYDHRCSAQTPFRRQTQNPP